MFDFSDQISVKATALTNVASSRINALDQQFKISETAESTYNRLSEQAQKVFN